MTTIATSERSILGNPFCADCVETATQAFRYYLALVAVHDKSVEEAIALARQKFAVELSAKSRKASANQITARLNALVETAKTGSEIKLGEEPHAQIIRNYIQYKLNGN
jgi:hypothetical protein